MSFFCSRIQSKISYCICCHVFLTSNLWKFLSFCLSDLDNLTSPGQLFCSFLQSRFVWCFPMVRLMLYILSKNTAEMMLWRVGFLIVCSLLYPPLTRTRPDTGTALYLWRHKGTRPSGIYTAFWIWEDYVLWNTMFVTNFLWLWGRKGKMTG